MKSFLDNFDYVRTSSFDERDLNHIFFNKASAKTLINFYVTNFESNDSQQDEFEYQQLHLVQYNFPNIGEVLEQSKTTLEKDKRTIVPVGYRSSNPLIFNKQKEIEIFSIKNLDRILIK